MNSYGMTFEGENEEVKADGSEEVGDDLCFSFVQAFEASFFFLFMMQLEVPSCYTTYPLLAAGDSEIMVSAP